MQYSVLICGRFPDIDAAKIVSRVSEGPGQSSTCKRRVALSSTVRWSAAMSADRAVREKWACSKAYAFTWGSVKRAFSVARGACISIFLTVVSSPAIEC